MLIVQVITPERKAVDAKTNFVAAPLFDGEIGIASGRSPLVGRLGAGELRIGRGEKAIRYFVRGGFLQVVNDEVYLLTDAAEPVDEIDHAEAAQRLTAEASQTAHGDAAIEKRLKATEAARTRLRLASR